MQKRAWTAQSKLDIPYVRHASSVVSFVDQMVEQALKLKASDIHLERYETQARLRYRLDGVLKEVQTNEFLFENFSAIATRIKVLAALDISDSRSAQDGRLNFSGICGKADIRISILPTVSGERIALRILPEVQQTYDFTSLGMSAAQCQQVEHALSATQGMLLVVGPTGSGKTTSLYTMIQQINHEGINILTIENPVERRIDGIGQVQVDETRGLGFGNALRTFLRQDPEVILVGEIRDHETATVAIKAAMTGHLVLSTVHANSALGTVARLLGLGIPVELIRNAIRLVVSQRLLRLICPHCKTEETPRAEEVAALSADEPATDQSFSIGRGCVHCANTGYRGRLGVFEMLRIDRQTPIEAVATGEPSKLKRWMLGDDLAKVCRTLLFEKKVSLAEYYRIVGRFDT